MFKTGSDTIVDLEDLPCPNIVTRMYCGMRWDDEYRHVSLDTFLRLIVAFSRQKILTMWKLYGAEKEMRSRLR